MRRAPGGLVLVLIVFVLASAVRAQERRTWTDRRGQSVEARFARLIDGDVVLTRGSRPVRVPFRDLIPEDQEYLRDYLTARGQGHRLPPPTPLSPLQPPVSGRLPGVGGLRDSGEPAEEQVRTWTDANGNQVEARLAGMRDGLVVLESEGTERSFPLDNFSPGDRHYIRRQMGLETDDATGSANPRMQPGRPGDAFRAAMERHQRQMAEASARHSSPPPSPPPPPPPVSGHPAPMAEDFSYQGSSPTTAEPRLRTGGSFSEVPSPPIPSLGYEEVKTCSNCQRNFPLHLTAGDRCPHCNVVFDVELNQRGQVVNHREGSDSPRYFTAIFNGVVGVGLLVFCLYCLARVFSPQ